MPFCAASSDEDRSLSSRQSNLTKQSGLSSSTGRGESNSSKGDAVLRQVYSAPAVAKREEKYVIRAKGLVAVILLLAVAGVASRAYLLVRDQERSNFENQFAGYASEIVTVSRSKADQFFEALDAFSASIASQAASENALRNTTWPFYAVPDWSVRAQKLATLTGVDNPDIVVAPIVLQNQSDAYAAFAGVQSPIWYQDSIEKQNYTKMTTNEMIQRTIPFIHYYHSETNYRPTPVAGSAEMAPTFQQYPVGPTPGIPVVSTNIDILSAPQTAELYRVSKAFRKPTIGFSQILVDARTEIPGSQIIQPIYDRADNKDPDRGMVAVAVIRLHWLDYFKNLLTDGENGIVVVLESACPKLCESFLQSVDDLEDVDVVSYRIDGSEAVLLGEFDAHDPQYNDLQEEAVFVDLGIDESLLPEGTCMPILTLHIYPSAELEESFQTDNAVIYTVVVVVIFLFTSLVFLLYDHFVNRRQRKVMERIAKQDMIVSDVFPTAIRNRLYGNQGKNKDDVLNKGFDALGLDDNFLGISNIIGSAPLADLFPSISVIFADIVGFTAWSSAREPQQVFILLETIYGAFDKIAYRHSVFKVETVGDCYVGAAGLPEPAYVILHGQIFESCIIDKTLKLLPSNRPKTT